MLQKGANFEEIFKVICGWFEIGDILEICFDR